MKFRWGIIGCGFVSELFASCLLKLENAELVAVASLTPGKAEHFCKKFGNPTAYDSYQKLVEDDKVDIVYIGTTHNFHYEHTLLGLNHDKHVLCEKPISLNAGLTEKMVSRAREKNLFLMEGVWTRFLPATLKLQEIIGQGVIGEVHVVNADFSIIRPFNPNHRLYNLELGGGALLDLGIYPLTFAQLVFDDYPQTAETTAVIGESCVDEMSSYLLEFTGGKTALLSASCRSASPHLGIITGSKGYITVPDFYHPQEFTVHHTDYTDLNWEPKDQKLYKYPYDHLGYGHEVTEVMRCIREGLVESPLMPWSVSLAMMRLMDSFRNQWGIIYPDE
ncbi:Gfo/Idh/MocA family oxidoreductase [bacterium]|nr:Gfo/Idh/MocA family oxidoreductase [bacterium]